MNYTAEGEADRVLWPTELHGNSPIRDPVPHKLFLYGRTHGRECDAETPISVAITFIDVAHDEPSRQSVPGGPRF